MEKETIDNKPIGIAAVRAALPYVGQCKNRKEQKWTHSPQQSASAPSSPSSTSDPDRPF